jgi:hypothetical protein
MKMDTIHPIAFFGYMGITARYSEGISFRSHIPEEERAERKLVK